MVEIPAGTFIMGSPPSESKRRDDDELQHEVGVSRFWISTTEITQGQWGAVMKRPRMDCRHGCGPDYPVNEVTWKTAAKFTNALSRGAGLEECYTQRDEQWHWDQRCEGFRLPTEAEWEYAARAGTATAYPHGDSRDICAFANFADARRVPSEPQLGYCDDGHRFLAPVGSLAPNPWGLHDMHGNVWEWVWDRYGTYSEVPAKNPVGPARGELRVIRGGSASDPPHAARSAYRGKWSPRSAADFIGLRIARGAPSPRP